MAPLTVASRILGSRAIRQQRKSSLNDPGHWDASINANGRLLWDGVDVAALTEQFGSPLLAVSRNRLLSDARTFRDATEEAFPGSLAAFSYKTNCVPALLQELHREAFAAEVISPYELWLADRLGVEGRQIIVNGVNKDAAFLRAAVNLGVRSINIDTPDELRSLQEICRGLGSRARVSLRLKVNPRSHFGLRLEDGEALRAAQQIARQLDTFEFVGLHFHELAANSDPQRHADHVVTAMRFAAQIFRQFGLETSMLNVGGGYAVPTTKVMSRFEYARQRLLGVPPRPPAPAEGIDIRHYMRRLADVVTTQCRILEVPKPMLAFEPGRFVSSRSHVLLTDVHSVKSNSAGPDFAMTDAGRILISYPCDYEFHQMFVANRMRAAGTEAYQLMGRLCTSTDWLAKYRCLPRLEPGDVIAVMDAGAYFMSYSSNFSFPRPGIVLLDKGVVRTIRRAQSFEHLTAMDDLAISRAP